MRGSLFAKSYAVVTAAVLTVAIMVLSVGIIVTEKVYIQSNAEGLKRAAYAAGSALPDSWTDSIASFDTAAGADAAAGTARDSAAAFIAKLNAASGFRVTLIDASGKVIGDSGADPATMSNHSDRPEMSDALAGKASWSRRKSSTMGEWMLYAAIPLRAADGKAPIGALRLALPLPGLMETLGPAKRMILIVALVAALVALFASAAFIRILSRPVILLSDRARRYAKGNLAPDVADATARRESAGSPAPASVQAPPRASIRSTPRELKLLEESLDEMASNLLGKASEAEKMGRRFSAILDSAGEAILALDSGLKIVEANPAAHGMLAAKPGTLVGALLTQISGSSALVDIARRCLTSKAAVTGDLILYSKNEKTVHVNASPLGGAENPGIVLAATDISVMKRLETMRTDFVANVSHELRTPIHLIRGFAETIRAGGLSGDETVRYLEIIERNALRMERIVEDLLSLARLEKEPSGWLTLEPCLMTDVSQSVFGMVKDQAEAKSVGLESAIPDDLRFMANQGLIEQALINLLENAIRYSPPGSAVRLEAERSGDFVEMRVKDHGSGIPAPDLERIFERFYRADKSRDRKSGGTGLGLAIVRHIAIAHGGTARAESWSGEGSVFSLRLPLSGLNPLSEKENSTRTEG
ncbi:MAG TPA: ATP-binding protein [Rectinemataceae bacterium]|nr:ATP-binding protein [Rectinemataceae bacterium]